MRATTALVVLTLVTGVVYGTAAAATSAERCDTRGRRCSTPPSRSAPPKALTERTLAGAQRLRQGERIVVPIVYHLMYGSYVPGRPGQEPDDLEHAPPLALVELQTEVLNRAFRGTKLSFVTADAELRSFAPWKTHPNAASPQPQDLVAMVHDLNAERRGVLHVFLLRQEEFTAAPPDTKRMFEDFLRRTDGILMNWDYLPYVPALRPVADPHVRDFFFEGETLVHLVGHYLGLLHTFEPWPGVGDVATEDEIDCTVKCAQISDRVRDTPVHRRLGSTGCLPLDTCPEYPGVDPIANFMNAEPDGCTSELTAGQIERMERMVRAWRPHFIVDAPASPP